MDRNNVRPIPVSINTKFLNCLQPEWSKYVTMVRHNQTGETVSLVQLEPHVLASKAKKAAKNHDPLALIAHSNASSSQSHANSSYSPQPYYVTHPSSVVDYEDEYQGELQGDSQEDKLTTAMVLLAREITQKFSTPTNNRPRTSSNTRNQAMIQDDRVDIQTKNAGYGGNGNKNAERQSRNQAFNAGNGNNDINQIIQRVPRTESTSGKANVQCYNCNEKGHYARDCQKPRVRDAKYFREQMLLAMKDEARSNINNEENDFMLDTSYGEETMEELITVVMLMDRIQPADGNAKTVPSYDAKAVSEVNASSKVHEQMRHEKRKTIIQTSDDDQIDSNIILDDPYVENNGVTSDHDSNDHDDYHKIQMLAYDVQREAKNKKRLNNELKKQKMLLQKKLETCKDRVRLQESRTSQEGHCSTKKMYDGEKLHSTKLVIDSPDSDETLEDAEESRLKMRNKMVQINHAKLNSLYETFEPQQDFSIEKTYFSIPSTSTNGSESKAVTSDLPILKMPKESKFLKMFDTLGVAINGLQTRIDITLLEDRQRRWMSDSQNSLREFYKTDVIPMFASLSKNLKELKELIEEKNKMLNAELEKCSRDYKDIQVNLLKRIKILENDFKRSQARSIDFELKLQHQKEKMACDVSWKSKLSTLNDENVLLKTQVEYVVQERENIKLEFQKLFNSIKATRTQHQKEVDELIEHVNQKTYAYADVRAQNQDLLMTISELKDKLRTIEKGKHVKTKFDKSETLGKLVCVTPFNKNLGNKAKNMSNTKVKADRSKPVTSHTTPKSEKN
ncbi:retrovirus-related pol polyprotein from transposon TNT 1-94 [Tanacetum coccineum]|uniref:Retrovirus-related pol polyprotein from transposon TNT 1-94 n=1 Tax=Tanacetum coccineum TaxID=301880 RepID=A0ABQ5IU69_9ASTR